MLGLCTSQLSTFTTRLPSQPTHHPTSRFIELSYTSRIPISARPRPHRQPCIHAGHLPPYLRPCGLHGRTGSQWLWASQVYLGKPTLTLCGRLFQRRETSSPLTFSKTAMVIDQAVGGFALSMYYFELFHQSQRDYAQVSAGHISMDYGVFPLTVL